MPGKPRLFSNLDLRTLYAALGQARAHTATPNAAFGVSFLRNAMAPTIEALDEIAKLPDMATEHTIYERERTALCTTYARKHPNGDPITVRLTDTLSQYDVPADKQADFAAALRAFNEVNKEFLARHRTAVDAAEAYFRGPSEFDITQVTKLPLSGFKDSTPGDVIDALFLVLAPPAPAV